MQDFTPASPDGIAVNKDEEQEEKAPQSEGMAKFISLIMAMFALVVAVKNYKTGNDEFTIMAVLFCSFIYICCVYWYALGWRLRKLPRVLIALLIFMAIQVGSLYIAGNYKTEENIYYCDEERLPSQYGINYRIDFCQIQTVKRDLAQKGLINAKTKDGEPLHKCIHEEVSIPESKFETKLGLLSIHRVLKSELLQQLTDAFVAVAVKFTKVQFLELHSLQLSRMVQIELAKIKRRDGLRFGNVFVNTTCE